MPQGQSSQKKRPNSGRRTQSSSGGRSRQFVGTEKQRRRQHAYQFIKRLLISITVAAILALLGYLLLSPRFMVKNLEVSSYDMALADRASQLIARELKSDIFLFSGANQFFWTKQRTNSLLQANLPAVESVTLSINDQVMSITIDPRVPVAAWCPLNVVKAVQTNFTKCMAIARNGEAFLHEDLSSKYKEKQFILVTDNKPAPASGQVVLPATLIEQLNYLRTELEKLNIVVDYVNQQELNIDLVLQETPEPTIKTILLPVVSDQIPDLVIKDLFLVLEKNDLATIASRENIAYFNRIDLTSPDKLFYQFTKKSE